LFAGANVVIEEPKMSTPVQVVERVIANGANDSGANAPSKGVRQHSCSPPPPSSMSSYSVINIPDHYLSSIEKQSKSFGTTQNLNQIIFDLIFASTSNSGLESHLKEMLAKYWAHMVHPLVCNISSSVRTDESGRALLKRGVCNQSFRMFHEIFSLKQHMLSISQSKNAAFDPDFMDKISSFLHDDNLLKAAVTSYVHEASRCWIQQSTEHSFPIAHCHSDFLTFCSSIGQSSREFSKCVQSWISEALLVKNPAKLSNPPYTILSTCNMCCSIFSLLRVSSLNITSSLLSFALAAQRCAPTENESLLLDSTILSVKQSQYVFNYASLSLLRLEYDAFAKGCSAVPDFCPCEDVSTSTVTLAHLFVMFFNSDATSDKGMSLEVQICCFCKMVHLNRPDNVVSICEALLLAFCVCQNQQPICFDDEFSMAFFLFVQSKFATRNIQPESLSKSFESKHPYDNSQDYDIDISFPGATSIEIVFDDKCRSEGGCDFVRFKVDDKVVGSDKYTGRGDSAHWAGVRGVPKLVIPGSKVTGHFHSDGSENDWGYKFIAVATFPIQIPPAMINELFQACITSLSNSQYLGVVLSGPCDSASRVRLFASVIKTHASDYHSIISGICSKFLHKDLGVSLFQIVSDICFCVEIEGSMNESALRLIFKTLCELHGHILRQLSPSLFFKSLFSELQVMACSSSEKCRQSAFFPEVSKHNQHCHGLLICAEMLLRLHTDQPLSLTDDSVIASSNVPEPTLGPVDTLSTVRAIRFRVRRSNGVIESNWRITPNAVARYGRIECENGEYTRECKISALKELNPEEFKDIILEPDVLNLLRGKVFKVKRSSGVIESGWSLQEGASIDDHGRVEVMNGAITRPSDIQELLELNPELSPPRIVQTATVGVPRLAINQSILAFAPDCHNLRTCCAWMQLLSQFSVSSSKSYVETVIKESKHPYDNSQDYDFDISFPGATSIEIVFDDRCRSEGGCDFVRFKVDDKVVGSDKYTGRGDSAHWAGVRGVPKLVIPGSKVTGHFHSDGSDNDWGYKLTATARVMEGQEDPYIKVLYDGLMECFIGMVIRDGKFSNELLNDELSQDVVHDVISLLVSSWKNPLVVGAFADILDGWLSLATPPETVSYFCASMCRLLLSSRVAVESLHFSVGDPVVIISESDKGSISWHRERQQLAALSKPAIHYPAEAAHMVRQSCFDGPADRRPSLTPWKGNPSLINLSNYSTAGQILFVDFGTVRGPAFHRQQVLGSYEIKVNSNSECPQFGFCTSNFPFDPNRSDVGCGDDENSWGWDGERRVFWCNGPDHRSEISWKTGDVLVFEVDFTKNTTSVSSNGNIMHVHSFSPSEMTLYPCITGGRSCDIIVRFPLYSEPLAAALAIPAPAPAPPAIDEIRGDLLRVADNWYTRSSVLKIECHSSMISMILSKICSEVNFSKCSPIQILFDAIMLKIMKQTGSTDSLEMEAMMWAASLVSSEQSAVPSHPVVELEHWRGPNSGVDLSHFASDNIVDFHSAHFCTVRGPAFHRHQKSCVFEIEILETGNVPQFGFCNADFARDNIDTGSGCGDDTNSWAWDGVRHRFWNDGSSLLPQISWACGDKLTFECDFASNLTHISKNGIRMHEYAFSPDVDTLFPALTGRGDKVKVYLKSSPAACDTFLQSFVNCCGSQSPFVASMRIILGNLLSERFIQDGKLLIPHSILSDSHAVEFLRLSLWFNGNEILQKASGQFISENFGSSSETTLSVCRLLISSLIRGIENLLGIFVKSGQLPSSSDIIFLDDSKRCSVVSSIMFSLAQSTFDKFLGELGNDVDPCSQLVNATVVTIKQMNDVFGKLPGITDVISSCETQILSKICLCDDFYSHLQPMDRELQLLMCKRLHPDMSSMRVISAFANGLNQMKSEASRRLAAKCVFVYMQKLACVRSPKPHSSSGGSSVQEHQLDSRNLPPLTTITLSNADVIESAAASSVPCPFADGQVKPEVESAMNEFKFFETLSSLLISLVHPGAELGNFLSDDLEHEFTQSTASNGSNDTSKFNFWLSQYRLLKDLLVMISCANPKKPSADEPSAEKKMFSSRQAVKKGSKVVLVPGYESMEDASGGPLQPGDVGEVIEDDNSGKPFHVRAISGASKGSTWWYVKSALANAPNSPSPRPSVQAPTISIKEVYDLKIASLVLDNIRSILSRRLLIDLCQHPGATSRRAQIKHLILESFSDDYVEMLVQLAVLLPRSKSAYSLHDFFFDLCTALIEQNAAVSDFSVYSTNTSISTQSQLLCPNRHTLKLVCGSKSSKKESSNWSCDVCKVLIPAGSAGILQCKLCKPRPYDVCVKCRSTLKTSQVEYLSQILVNIYSGISKLEPGLLKSNAEELFAESFNRFVQSSTQACGVEVLSNNEKVCEGRALIQFLVMNAFLLCRTEESRAVEPRTPVSNNISVMCGVFKPPFNNMIALSLIPAKFETVIEKFAVMSELAHNYSKSESKLRCLIAYIRHDLRLSQITHQEVEKSKSFESQHPYDNSQDYDFDISFPGATSIEIVFDDRCRSEGGCDFVRFKVDDKVVGSDKYTGRGDSAHWAGVRGVPKLVIPGSKVTGHFHSDGSDNDWGYKLTATARVMEGQEDPYIKVLYDGLMECFIGMVIRDGKFSNELLNDELSQDVVHDVISLLVSSWKNPLVVGAFADILDGWLSLATPPETVSYFCASMCRLLLSSRVAVESLHFSVGDPVVIISESDKGSVTFHENRHSFALKTSSGTTLHSPQSVSGEAVAVADVGAAVAKLAAALSSSSPLNSAGYPMKLGCDSCTFYCGRNLGEIVIPGSDGYCGPDNGPQCPDCKMSCGCAKIISNATAPKGKSEGALDQTNLTVNEAKGALVRIEERWLTRTSVLRMQNISEFHHFLGRYCDIFESRPKNSDGEVKPVEEAKHSQSNSSLLSKFKSAAFAVQLAAKVNIFSRHSFLDRFLLMTHYVIKSLSAIGYGSNLEMLMPHILDWIKDLSGTRTSSMHVDYVSVPCSEIKVGDKVVIGPDWMWPIPPCKSGTVNEVGTNGWVNVSWPTVSDGLSAWYRFGFNNAFDVLSSSAKPSISPQVFEVRMRILLHIALSNLCLSNGQLSVSSSIVENEQLSLTLMRNIWFNGNEALQRAVLAVVENYFSFSDQSKSICQFAVRSFVNACNFFPSSSSVLAKDMKFCVVFKGYLYRTLAEGWNPHQVRTSTSDAKDQSKTYLPLPPGFHISPHEPDCVEVIASHGWDTQALVLADGSSVGTKSYPSQTGKIEATNQLKTEGETFRPGYCSRGILIRMRHTERLQNAAVDAFDVAEAPFESALFSVTKMFSADLSGFMEPFFDTTKSSAFFHSMLAGSAQTLFEQNMHKSKGSLSAISQIVTAARQSASVMHTFFGSIPGLFDVISSLEGVLLCKACLLTDIFSVNSHFLEDKYYIFNKVRSFLGDPKIIPILRDCLALKEFGDRFRFVARGIYFFLEEARCVSGTVLETPSSKFVLKLFAICLDSSGESASDTLMTMLEDEVSTVTPHIPMTEFWISNFGILHKHLEDLETSSSTKTSCPPAPPCGKLQSFVCAYGTDYQNSLVRLRSLFAHRVANYVFDSNGFFTNPELPQKFQEYLEIAIAVNLQDVSHSNKFLFNLSSAASVGNALSISVLINAFRRRRQQQTDEDVSLAYFLQICSGSSALVFQNDLQKFLKSSNQDDACRILAHINELCDSAIRKVVSVLQPAIGVPLTNELGVIDFRIQSKLKHHLAFILPTLLNNSWNFLIRSHFCSQIHNFLQSVVDSPLFVDPSQSESHAPANVASFFQSVPHMNLAISSLSDDSSTFEDVNISSFHWSVIPDPGISGGTPNSSLNKNGLNQEMIEFGSHKSANLLVQSAIGNVSLVTGSADWQWEVSFCAFDRRVHVSSVGIVVGNFEKGAVHTKDKFFLGISSRHGYLRNGKIVKAASFGPGDHIRLCFKSMNRSLQIAVNGVAGYTFDSITLGARQDVFPVARTNRPSCQVVVLDCFSNMSSSLRNPYNRVFPAVERVVSSFTQTLDIANVVALAVSTQKNVSGGGVFAESCKFDTALTLSIDSGFSFSENDSAVKFPNGPVICFSDIVCGPTCTSKFVYLCFKYTGSNEAWSIGVVPESKVNDKNYLWKCPQAVGRYNAGSGCVLQSLSIPTDATIIMCIDALEAVWILYVSGREVCRQDIPPDHFPCRFGINGHNGSRFKLVVDEEPPDFLSVRQSSRTFSNPKWSDMNDHGLFSESSAQLLILRMINKCCSDAVLGRLLSLSKSDEFNPYHSIVKPLLALDVSARGQCIEFILQIISMHHPTGISGATFVENVAAQLFTGVSTFSPHSAVVCNRFCSVASSGAFSTSRRALTVLSGIVQPITEISSKQSGVYKCCVPLWCINSLAPDRAQCFKVRFGQSVGVHTGVMIDAGWANVFFGDHHFQVPVSCACLLSIVMDFNDRSETFDLLFLQERTELPPAIVRCASEELEKMGIFEFSADRKAVRLVLTSTVHGDAERAHRPLRTPFMPCYLQLVKYLFECFQSKDKNGRLDEVLFTFDAVSVLDVDPGSVGYLLCDLERKELIRRCRGFLYPFYEDRQATTQNKSPKILALIDICSKSQFRAKVVEEPPIVGSTEPSILQAALDDLLVFDPFPQSSWLTSLVLFVPDHSIECPHPWTSVVASGLTVASMETFCEQAAPALLDICNENNRDSLHVAQVFLRQQGCVASTLLEVLATSSDLSGLPEGAPVAFKTQENGYCLVCMDDEVTLYSPCAEGSQPECWKCRVCWSHEVNTVRPSFLCCIRH
jgi:hypothetical protein